MRKTVLILLLLLAPIAHGQTPNPEGVEDTRASVAVPLGRPAPAVANNEISSNTPAGKMGAESERGQSNTFPEFPTRPPSLLIHYIADLLNKFPLIGILIILLGIDIVLGTLAALVAKKLSSSVSWRGMTRKGASILVIGMAAAVEPLSGLPLAKLVSLFYIWTEAISIVEAAAALGVPLPPMLLTALIKLRESDKIPLVPVIPVAVAATPANTNLGGTTLITVRGNASIRPGPNSTVMGATTPDGGDARTQAITENTAATSANTAAVQEAAHAS